MMYRTTSIRVRTHVIVDFTDELIQSVLNPQKPQGIEENDEEEESLKKLHMETSFVYFKIC
jgi:hypothetical protein